MRLVTKTSAENILRDVDDTTTFLFKSFMWFHGTRLNVLSRLFLPRLSLKL